MMCRMQRSSTKGDHPAHPTDARDESATLEEPASADDSGRRDRREALTPLPAARLWLVDGYNVLHCAPFQRDQQSAAVRSDSPSADKPFWSATKREHLVAFARCFPDPNAEIWLVFDGTRAPEKPHRGEQPLILLEFAPSADDWIVKRVRDAEHADQIAVVSGDRRLTGKTRHHGAAVVSPRLFLDHCIQRGAAIPQE